MVDVFEACSSFDRRYIERTLDRIARDNRPLIAVVVPTVGALVLIMSAELPLPEAVAFNPLLLLLGIVVMRVPLTAGIAPLLDRNATVAILAITLYAYGIEYLGVSYGVPYGHFSYGTALGPMLFGVVPFGLPLLFLPIVVNGYVLSLLLLGKRADQPLVRCPVAIAATIGMDLVLDPAAVDLGFWSYATGGRYYGVPILNYVGWCLSATVAVSILDLGFERTALRTRVNECEFILDTLVGFVVFWGITAAYFGNHASVLVAGLFALSLRTTSRLRPF